jgi:hypothetical protein
MTEIETSRGNHARISCPIAHWRAYVVEQSLIFRTAEIAFWQGYPGSKVAFMMKITRY